MFMINLIKNRVAQQQRKGSGVRASLIYKRICFFMLALVMLAACSKKDDATSLSVSPGELSFAATGGSSNVSITTSAASWAASDTSYWCSTSTSGNTLSVTIQPNISTQQRTTIVAVVAGGLSKTIKITQAAAEPVTPSPATADSIAPDQTGMRAISAIDLAKQMTAGWNIGNSLEAIGSETAWGNPMITKRLIDSVKAAGFNAIRIPVAWSRFTNAATFTIDTNWIKRVEEVVKYVVDNDMYAIMNIHWDNGWMVPTYAQQTYVNNRLTIMWKQIAIRFRNYDDHLLFAGTNEVMVTGDYGTPTSEYYTVQNSFNQTFVSAIRSTGGKNAYRHLVVQGFNTNIDHTVNFFTVPKDPVANKLMVEVHYYDPYNFTLNENSSITQWGKDATDPARTETWANEAYADGQFQKMKTKFIDKGYPVILGEYAAMARTTLGTTLNADHAKYRRYYLAYISKSAAAHGLVPFYWDSGYTGDKGSGLFNRSDGSQAYPDMIKALLER